MFELTYAITVENPRTKARVTRELRKGGADVPVTYYNRADFVQRYVRFLLVESIERPFQAFKEGFQAVLEPQMLKVGCADREHPGP